MDDLFDSLSNQTSPTYETESHKPPDMHVFSLLQVQRRLSPRLHPNQSTQQRRLSPRLHPHQHTPKAKIWSDRNNKALSLSGMRRLSPRLHTDLPTKRTRQNLINQDHCKLDFHCSNVNGITNGVPSQHINMAIKVLANEAKKQIETPDLAARSDHARIKETLRIFNTYFLQCAQEEEERCKQSATNVKKIGDEPISKGIDIKRTSSRPDLKALKKMQSNNEILYPEKMIGHIPGVDIGYQFYSRSEMVAVGVHSQWLNGVDYIGKSRVKKEELQKYTFPIAVAVVLSGQYEDDLDNANDIIYTGEGMHDMLSTKLQHGDQVLIRGNLALKNSMEQSIPIRVIRGHRNADSYSGSIYSYDGLYKVIETWADKGCRGYLVYKYCLVRLEGQPKLVTHQVQYIRGSVHKDISKLPGLVCADLSNGIEDIPIPVTNIVDKTPVCPPGFTYIKSIEIAESVNQPPHATGCNCKGNCTNPNTCACAKLNGLDFPYIHRNGGRLVEPKDIVFECGPNCSCKAGCLNRISQRAIKYRLEVYRTPDKGWAVRSWDYIPSGAPVCEYIGVVRRSDELDNIAENDFIFEIDCLHTINEIEGRERRYGPVSSATAVLPKLDKKTLDGAPEFCIDAGSRGNVARFINHSCEPNLFVQCILREHHDLRLARIVLIAAENISPMEELTYDYGYALNSVIGPDGQIKVLPCFCQTADCRKRLY